MTLAQYDLFDEKCANLKNGGWRNEDQFWELVFIAVSMFQWTLGEAACEVLISVEPQGHPYSNYLQDQQIWFEARNARTMEALKDFREALFG